MKKTRLKRASLLAQVGGRRQMENEVPQPQVDEALGFFSAKNDPIRSST
jgi:hypothetical protein